MVTLKKLSIGLAGAMFSVSCLGLEPVHAHGLITGPHPHPEFPTQGVQDYLVVPPGAPGRPAYYEASGGLDRPFNLYTVLANTDETGGTFNFFTFYVEPGGGVLPHTHSQDAEALYILEGQFEVMTGDTTTLAPPGSFVYLPIGRPHAFNNIGTEPALALSFTTPVGLAQLFEQVGVLSTGDGPPPPSAFDFEEALTILPQFGLDLTAQTLPGPLLDFVVVPPGAPGRPTFEGPFGSLYTSLATFEETGGDFSYSIFSLPSQSGLPPLTQSSNGESFYVLDGDLTFQLGNQTTVATPGSYVYIPAGKPYAITNLDTTLAKAVSISVATSVPEPSSWLGILGVGGYLGTSLVLKRKHKKQKLSNL
jgi:quercetin dioxygenase-like cupin family protein